MNSSVVTNYRTLLSNSANWRRQFDGSPTYDTLSRPKKVTLAVNGSSAFYTRTYNGDGRIDTLTYPSGFVAKYVYTARGYLQQIQDNSNGAVLWQANLRDAEQHLLDQGEGSALDVIQVFDPNNGLVTQVRASNDGNDDGSVTSLNFTYDKFGNLQERSDAFGATEFFCYDDLNRLQNYAVNGTDCHTGSLVKTVGYDDTGNIASKSDVGSLYQYPLPGQPQPHAVSAITGTVNGIVNPKYSYDSNGNMTCIYTGSSCHGTGIARETDTWWSFNMLHTMSQGANVLSLTYDSEHARLVQTLTYATSITTTTYLGDPASGSMSEKVVVGAATTWNDYLMADGRMIGERICISASPTCTGTPTFEYFVADRPSLALRAFVAGNSLLAVSPACGRPLLTDRSRW